MPQRTEELLHFKGPPRENAARHAWFPWAKEQLAAITALPQGWDSGGAAPPIPTVVFGAESLLLSLCHDPALPQPHIHPTRSGGVQFEWENGTRYFEIEVQGERAVTYFYQDNESARELKGALAEDTNIILMNLLIRSVSRMTRYSGHDETGHLGGSQPRVQVETSAAAEAYDEVEARLPFRQEP